MFWCLCFSFSFFLSFLLLLLLLIILYTTILKCKMDFLKNMHFFLFSLFFYVLSTKKQVISNLLKYYFLFCFSSVFSVFWTSSLKNGHSRSCTKSNIFIIIFHFICTPLVCFSQLQLFFAIPLSNILQQIAHQQDKILQHL